MRLLAAGCVLPVQPGKLYGVKAWHPTIAELRDLSAALARIAVLHPCLPMHTQGARPAKRIE
jgi:hypothetical protein